MSEVPKKVQKKQVKIRSSSLPKLRRKTLQAIKECFPKRRSGRKPVAHPSSYYQAKNICPELMVMVLSIRAFKERVREGFYDDTEEEHGARPRNEDWQEHVACLEKLALISEAAIAAGDPGFAEHLAFAIKFSADVGNRRRFHLVAVLETCRWIEGPLTLEKIMRISLKCFHRRIESRRTLMDDLTAMKVKYHKEARRAPRKTIPRKI